MLCFNLNGFASVTMKVFVPVWTIKMFRFDRCDEQGGPLLSPFHEIFLFYCDCIRNITSCFFLFITRMLLNSLLNPVYYCSVLVQTQKARAALCHIVELASYICTFMNFFTSALISRNRCALVCVFSSYPLYLLLSLNPEFSGHMFALLCRPILRTSHGAEIGDPIY